MIITKSIRAFFLTTLLPLAAAAQTPAPPATTQTNAQAKSQNAAQSRATVNATEATGVDEHIDNPHTGTLVDQVIGVVNGDLILESDVEEERRFGVFQPFTSPSGAFSRDKAIERLVDRALILQQVKLQPEDKVTTADATAELNALRKQIPACKAAHCETEAGWNAFVQAQGFTLPELTERWRQRMEILKFIEQRFRAGIRIEPAEIKDYYEQSLLPEYARQKVKAPSLEVLSERVQEVLLQQRVSALLGDWLEQLKAQGSVRMMRPDEVAP